MLDEGYGDQVESMMTIQKKIVERREPLPEADTRAADESRASLIVDYIENVDSRFPGRDKRGLEAVDYLKSTVVQLGSGPTTVDWNFMRPTRRDKFSKFSQELGGEFLTVLDEADARLRSWGEESQTRPDAPEYADRRYETYKQVATELRERNKSQ